MALFNFNILNPAATVPISITLTGLYNPNQQEDARILALRQERANFAQLMSAIRVKAIFDEIGTAMSAAVPGLFARRRIFFNRVEDDVEIYPFQINAEQGTYTQTLTFHVKAYPKPGVPFDRDQFVNLVLAKREALENYVNALPIYNRSEVNQAFFQGDPNVQILMNQAGGKRRVRKSRKHRRSHKKSRKQTKNRK
jgi:hypothetical protein